MITDSEKLVKVLRENAEASRREGELIGLLEAYEAEVHAITYEFVGTMVDPSWTAAQSMLKGLVERWRKGWRLQPPEYTLRAYPDPPAGAEPRPERLEWPPRPE